MTQQFRGEKIETNYKYYYFWDEQHRELTAINQKIVVVDKSNLKP